MKIVQSRTFIFIKKMMTKAEINSYPTILLLLSTNNCSVCLAIDKRVKKWLETNYPHLTYTTLKLEKEWFN